MAIIPFFFFFSSPSRVRRIFFLGLRPSASSGRSQGASPYKKKPISMGGDLQIASQFEDHSFFSFPPGFHGHIFHLHLFDERRMDAPPRSFMAMKTGGESSE
uniref:hypothetical protein n=1 Tax=Cephaleuros parasiticus TaxID=173370 RepID=UPI001EE1080C|nr:hypothetical protein MFQ79_pgp086 [Cephaleuros parasiticus]UIB38976.1 hypothetical protein [Cephaleuros parasiticus]